MKRDQALDTVKKLTMDDRNKTHGDPIAQFEKAQRIKAAVDHMSNPDLTPAEKEAIESICTKLSRWTTGKATGPARAEHPLDIIGYASIAVEAIYAGQPGEGTITEVPVGSLTGTLSEFAGVGQLARRLAPNPRRDHEAKPESAA